MKREDLKALGLSDEHIAGVMALHGNDVTTWNARITEAENKSKPFEGVDVNALKQQVTDLQNQLADKDKAHAISDFFRDVKFSSGLARAAAETQFKTKNFELKDGTFEGAAEWLEELKKNEPGAFVTEETQQNAPDPQQKEPKKEPDTGESKLITTGLQQKGAPQNTATDFEKYFQELNPGLKF